ncbi:MAG: DUF4270 domain-containing protein [Saprospiraceae bacterium]|nr:DUF4270 domain-containing protein [Saprospiraceae bacterium]
MNRILEGLFVAICCLGLLVGCTDPTIVGEELLEGDKVQPGFTDTISISSYTSRLDSFRTYSSALAAQLGRYAVGNFQDPVFGSMKASSVIQARMQRDPIFFTLNPPNFGTGATVDSVVLVLPYDSESFYGNLNQIYSFEVMELAEGFAREDDYYSNSPLPALGNQLASQSFRPSPNDSTVTINYSFDVADTIRFPHVRVPLPVSLGEQLVTLDSTFFESDSAFLSFLPGLALRPTSENGGLTTFNLSPSSPNGSQAGVYVYYRTSTDLKNQYQFGFNEFAGRYVNYETDFAGSEVQPYLGEGNGDTLLFLKGGLGTEIKISFPYITELKGLIVNEALLEMAYIDFPGAQDEIYDPVQQLTLSRNTDDGIFLIDDFVLAPTDLVGFSFGGDLEDGPNGEAGLYTMNVSTHLQRMIDGDESNELILAVFRRGDNHNRGVMAGSNHPDFPMKLKVTFTKP